MDEELGVGVGEAQDLVLKWATASGDSWEKLRFLKRYLNCLTAEESQKASVINLHVKRRKQKDKSKSVEAPEAVSVPTSVVSPAEAVDKGWLSKWKAGNFADAYGIGIEKISKPQENSTAYKQEAATISVANIQGQVVKE